MAPTTNQMMSACTSIFPPDFCSPGKGLCLHSFFIADSSTIHGGGKRRAVNVRSIATFGRCHRLFNRGMAPLFRIKDGYLRIWMSFLYLLCSLFGRFICSKPGLQLSVHGHIILFDERHCSAY